jgi:hypothetical protein
MVTASWQTWKYSARVSERLAILRFTIRRRWMADTLAAWRAYQMRLQRLTRLSRLLAPRVRLHRLRQHLHDWIDQLCASRQTTADVHQATVSHLMQFRHRRAFDKWLGQTNATSDRLMRKQRADGFHQRYAIHQALFRWNLFSRTRAGKRETENRIWKMNGANLVLRLWNAWKQRTARILSCKKVAAVLKQALQRTTLQMWQHEMTESDRLTRMLVVARHFHGGRSDRSKLFTLHRWHTRARAHKAHFLRLAQLYITSTQFRVHSEQRMVWRAWKRRYADATTARSRMHRADQMCRHAVQLEVWRWWMQRMQHRDTLRTRWVKFAKHNKKSIAVDARIISQTTALLALGHPALLRLRENSLPYFVPSSSSSISRSSLPMLFQLWRDVRDARRRAILAEEWCRSQLRLKVMRAWASFVHGKKQRLTNVARSLRGEARLPHAHWTARRTKPTLNLAAADAPILESASKAEVDAEFAADAMSRAVIATQGGAMAQKLERLEAMEWTAQTLARRLLLQRSWFEWTRSVQDRHRSRLADRAAILLQQRRVFDTWRAYLVRRRENQLRDALADRARLCFQLRSTFYAWMERYEQHVRQPTEQEKWMQVMNASVESPVAPAGAPATPPSVDPSQQPALSLADVLETFASPRVAQQLQTPGQKPREAVPQHAPATPTAALQQLLQMVQQGVMLSPATTPPRTTANTRQSTSTVPHSLTALAELSSASLLLSPASSSAAQSMRVSVTEYSVSTSENDTTGNRTVALEEMGEHAHTCFLMRRFFYGWLDATEKVQRARA